jgi:hypothetical protein
MKQTTVLEDGCRIHACNQLNKLLMLLLCTLIIILECHPTATVLLGNTVVTGS